MSRGKENRRCCTRSAPLPSQSRLTPCQLPRKGSFSRSGGKQSKTSPFRGRWHRAAMTERVLSVPPALFLSGLALSVTFGDTSPKGREQTLSGAPAPAPPRGERALARSATLPQKAALQMLSAVTTPSRENAMPERPQTLRHCSIINNISAEYAQSSAERIPIVFLRTAPLPPDAPAKHTAMPRRTGSPP